MSICSGNKRSVGVVNVFVFIVTLCGSSYAYPQAGPSRAPIPVAGNELGRYDAAALAEVLAHLQVVGTTAWAGMQGTGTITYGSDQNSYSATLTIVGSRKSRLDVQASTGTISSRINNRLGNIQQLDGKMFPLAPEIAASGIVQFELPRLAELQTRSSVIDHGVTVIDDMNLHRVTIEQPLTPKKNIATDLYFDPRTHLLIKTANSIRPDGSQRDLLRVITYGDYRSIDGVMIPFLYTQSLDGQKQWTTRLSEVKLNPTLQSNYFEF